MVDFKKRSVVKMGSSLWVSLPKAWTQYENVQEGQELNASLSPEGNALMLTPNVIGQAHKHNGGVVDAK